MRTPEEVVTSAFAAINIEDWHGLTALCDPLSLEAFKRQVVRHLTSLAEWHGLADDDPEFDPMEKIRHAEDPEYFVQSEIAGATSVEGIRQMDPARIFAGWLRNRLFFESIPDDELESPGYANAVSRTQRTVRSYRYSVVGSVLDGPDISHVVFRSTDTIVETYDDAQATDIEESSDDARPFDPRMHQYGDPDVLTCRKQPDGSWRILAKRSFFLIDTIEEVDARLGE